MGKNIFLDLGTYNCQGLFYYKKMFLPLDKSWEVHTFEPNLNIKLDCLDKLEFPVIVHRKAIWLYNGKTTFNLHGPQGTSQGSLVSDTIGSKFYSDLYNKVEVECIDLLDFIKSNFCESDNIYIKMDIEWAEYSVLQHMLKNGWSKNIKKIWIEWHGHKGSYYNMEKTSEELIQLISSTGTEVYECKRGQKDYNE